MMAGDTMSVGAFHWILPKLSHNMRRLILRGKLFASKDNSHICSGTLNVGVK